MDSYKEINKELILGNQELKMQQSIYQKQIIILKRQLMDELERRVELEKMMKMMLIDNFKNALKLLDPDSSLLKILQDNGEFKVEERRQEPVQRQPTQILQELRRSNSLHRRSSIVVSPRRCSYPMKIATPESTDVELEQQEESNDKSLNSVENMSMEEDLDNSTDKLACIIEDAILEEKEEDGDAEDEEEAENVEKDEQDEEEENSYISNIMVEDTLRSLQNMSVTEAYEDMSITEIEKNDEDDETCENSFTQPPLVKEKQTLENSSPSQTFLKNKRRNACYLRRSPLQEISNLKNSTVEENESATIQLRNPTNVVVKRGKRRSLYGNESIESVRHMNSQRMDGKDELEVEPLSIGLNSYREPSLESGVTSLALSELTCGQFANAASSTPNSSKFQNNNGSSETINSINTTQSRSSRRCKPTCLTEPKLNLKMRNEDQPISHQSARTKSRKKRSKK